MNSIFVDRTLFLFAAGMDDIIPVVVTLLFVLVPVIGNLLANANKKNPQGRPPIKPGGGPKPRANPGVDKEVADFLRRVAQNQGGGNAPAQGARPQGQQGPRPGQVPLGQQRPGQAGPGQARPGQARPGQAGRALPPRPGVRQQQRPPVAGRGTVQPTVQAQVVPEEARPPIQESGDRLGTSKRFGSGSRLGADVNDEVRKEEQRRQRKFSHSVDSLKEHSLRGNVPLREQRKKETKEPAVPAVDWAAMLGNVDNVRQAFVFSEILQRPEHRWL